MADAAVAARLSRAGVAAALAHRRRARRRGQVQATLAHRHAADAASEAQRRADVLPHPAEHKAVHSIRAAPRVHRKTKTQNLGQLNLETKGKKLFLEVILTPIPK